MNKSEIRLIHIFQIKQVINLAVIIKNLNSGIKKVPNVRIFFNYLKRIIKIFFLLKKNKKIMCLPIQSLYKRKVERKRTLRCLLSFL